MDAVLQLLAPLVCLGIGWMLCQEGIQALRSAETRISGRRIIGRLAQVAGGALLLLGVPLIVLSVLVGAGMLVEVIAALSERALQ